MRLAACLLIVLIAGCTANASPPSTDSPTVVPPLETLTTEWGCGHGFWVSNAEQTAALHISYLGDGEPEREAALPHDDWEVVLLVGRDLHANWCDDVIERHEPTPVETGRFPVSAGELRLVGEVPADFSGGELTVEAIDLQVTMPDGTTAEWGSTTITNPMWGLFAG